MSKARLDSLLVARGLAPTRERAQALVMAGDIFVDGRPAAKPGMAIPETAAISARPRAQFVSRGGVKLAGALDAFGLDPAGLVGLDVGASTGGFTDCLLQRGARRMYAIDVGRGQLHHRLLTDERVVAREQTNARFPYELAELVDCIVADVSFISLRLVLPPAVVHLRSGGWVVCLIKPQFEAGRGQVGRGGIVRDPAIHRAVLDDFSQWTADQDWGMLGLVASAIHGGDGNQEFLAWLTPGTASVEGLVDAVLETAA